MELHLFVVFLALVRLISGQSGDNDAPSIPSLPNFFSGYTEAILNIEGFAVTVNSSRSFYDIDMNLARIDVAGESEEGPTSLVQDITVGVTYTIYRQYSNCTVSPLIAGTDVRRDQDGRFYLRNVNDLLLLSAINYTYAGNMSAHGVMLDNWKFTGNFSHAGYNYTNSTVQWSITRSGQAISNIASITSTPIPWRLSADGLATATLYNETVMFYFSSVSRFFDLSFEEPSFDVFDVSICVDPKDALFLTLAVPGVKNGINLGQFKGNVRKSVSNYTQLFPIQVGNVQIPSENVTFLFVSLQISNLTSTANVSSPMTAQEAYNNIMNNTVDGQAPFQIEIRSGVKVTPYIFNPNKAETCQNASITPTPSSIPSPSVIIITTTTTVTVTPVITCTPMPTQPPTTPSTCPPNTAPPLGVSQSHVVGIAFGTLITGSFMTCVGLVVCFVCYQKTRTRKWSPTTMGYQKTPDTITEKEYFQ